MKNSLPAPAFALAIALLLSQAQAYAECPRIETLIEREQRLQYHLDRGIAEGQLSPGQSERLGRRLQKLNKEICTLRDRHCLTADDERWLNEQMTDVSAQLFRAIHKAETRLAGRPGF